MSSTTIKTIAPATVQNGTLILHFENAETPMVSRLDLDSLAQATFEVQQKDGAYYLRLHDSAAHDSNTGQNFGKFTTKADAHQALHAILQALLAQQPETMKSACSTSAGRCSKKGKCGWLLCFGKIILFLLVAFILFSLGGLNGMRVAEYKAQQKSVATTEAPVAAPTVAEQPAAVPTPETVTAPEGEAMDADALLGGNEPAAATATP